MKLLVVSQYFYPENFRINELCFELVKKGHSVTVLTGYPNYPEGEIYPAYQDRTIKYEEINGVLVHRVDMRPRKKNAINLFRNYLSYAYKGSLGAFKLEKDYDAIFVFEVSPITQVIPALIYKMRHKVPIFVNCQDIWPDVIKVYGIKEKSIVFKMVKALSAWLYNKADLIITSSPGFNNYLKNVCKVPHEKMKYLPNFAEEFYLEFGNQKVGDDKLHLLFAGNIGKAQNLDVIVEAVAKLTVEERQSILVDILGDGSYLPTLKTKIREKELEDVFEFHGRKPVTEIKAFYEYADAFLITLEGNSPVSMTIPSKLQGYMGAGKPIIGSIDGGAYEIIKLANCGECVKANDAEGLAQILKKYIANAEYFSELGLLGKKYFKEHFSLEIYVKKLVEMMEGSSYDNF